MGFQINIYVYSHIAVSVLTYPIPGTWDYLGLNHYTTQLISDDPNNRTRNGTYTSDQEIQSRTDDDWPK